MLLQNLGILSYYLIPLFAIDQTLKENAKGCLVVRAAYDKIIASKIFSNDDNFLLPRIALVSDFGESIFLNGAEGIWQTSQQNLQSAQKIMLDKNLSDKIRKILCIDFATAKQSDMKMALYSIACAALMIEGGKEVPMRAQSEEQKKYWIDLAGVSDVKFSQTFSDGSNSLENIDKNDEKTSCFLCQQGPTDLYMNVDSSGSIGNADFEKQRQIMISLLDAFKESMDSEASQACVSFFTKYFAGRSLTTDYSYMLNYIKSYTYEGGGTYTHKAFDMDYEEFSESNARVKDKAVRTIIFVLTDGQSGRPDLLPQSVKKVKDHSPTITIYAIGTTSDAYTPELELMASEKRNARKYPTMQDFQNDLSDILYQSCKLALQAGEGQQKNNSHDQKMKKEDFCIKNLKVGESRFYSAPFSRGEKVYLRIYNKQLDLQIYASFSQPYPSAADHEFKVFCKTKQAKCFVLIQDTTQLSPDCEGLQLGNYFWSVTATGPSGFTGVATECGSIEKYPDGSDYFDPNAGDDSNGSMKKYNKEPLSVTIRKLNLQPLIIYNFLFFKLSRLSA